MPRLRALLVVGLFVGLVVHEAQLIPDPGQVFTFYGYRIEILRRSRNKIVAVRIKRLDGQDAAS